jgi:hypothetical protein
MKSSALLTEVGSNFLSVYPTCASMYLGVFECEDCHVLRQLALGAGFHFSSSEQRPFESFL